MLRRDVRGRPRLSAAEPGSPRDIRDSVRARVHAAGHHRRALQRRSCGASHLVSSETATCSEHSPGSSGTAARRRTTSARSLRACDPCSTMAARRGRRAYRATTSSSCSTSPAPRYSPCTAARSRPIGVWRRRRSTWCRLHANCRKAGGRTARRCRAETSPTVILLHSPRARWRAGPCCRPHSSRGSRGSTARACRRCSARPRRWKNSGRQYGADLTQAEVRYLVEVEWARSAEDILWRRTRLGLRFPASAVNDLQDAVAQLL